MEGFLGAVGSVGHPNIINKFYKDDVFVVHPGIRGLSSLHTGSAQGGQFCCLIPARRVNNSLTPLKLEALTKYLHMRLWG
jgi:orotidine-5'-phosphate decarboxylase